MTTMMNESDNNNNNDNSTDNVDVGIRKKVKRSPTIITISVGYE